MNLIPQFQQDNLNAEIPPPIPPKMMVQGSENDDADVLELNGYHHQMNDSDTPTPVLPPKPNNRLAL